MINNDVIVIPGLKLSLSGYVREAASLVGKGNLISDREIHDARVSLKKARALLKLIRSQVEEDFWKREYETFRSSGRALSGLRESAVHRKVLKDLKKKKPAVFKKISNPATEQLMRKPDRDQAVPEETLSGLEEIGGSLKKSYYRIRFEPLGCLNQALLIKDLGRTWLGVRKAYLICRNDPAEKRIHEFRKRAKDFMYQLAFFKSLNPSGVRTVIRKTDRLTRELGRHHDLAVLIKAIGYKYGPDNDPYLDELAILIRGEQDRALLRVWPAAWSLFGPSVVLMEKLGVKVLIL